MPATSSVLGSLASIMGRGFLSLLASDPAHRAAPMPQALSSPNLRCRAHNIRRYGYPLAGVSGPIGVWLCSFSEWALAAFFHELTVAAEVAEERQVPVP